MAANDQDAPFGLTVVSDFGADMSARGVSIRVGPDSANELFSRLRARVELSTIDLLSGSSRRITWGFDVRSIRAFESGTLLGAFAPTSELHDWYRQIDRVRRAGTGIPDLVQSAMKLWSEVPLPDGTPADVVAERPTSQGEEVDALLDLVDLSEDDGSERETSPRDLRLRLTATLGNRSLDWKKRLDLVERVVLDGLSRQLEAILHDPTFRDIEAAWRMLWAVARAADLRRGDLRLHMVSCPRPDAASVLDVLIEALRSGREESPGRGALVIDHPVGANEQSARFLASAALLARSMGSRLVASLDPTLHDDDVDRASGRAGTLGTIDNEETEALVDQIGSLAGPGGGLLTFNRFLSRSPYSPDEHPAVVPDFHEDLLTPDGPLANGGWLVARALAEAVKRSGPTAGRAVQRFAVRSLPLRPIKPPRTAEHVVPLEWFLDRKEAGRLHRRGVSPLVCALDRDDAEALDPHWQGAAAGSPTADGDRTSTHGPMSLRFIIRADDEAGNE